MQANLEHRAATLHMTEQGYTARRIAEELGITSRTVVRHRAALGIAKPKAPLITAEEHTRILEMLEDGVPLAEIARTIGRPPETLWVRYKGMSPTGNPYGSSKLRQQLGLLLT